MLSHSSAVLRFSIPAALFLVSSNALAQQFTVVDLNLVSEQRITRTLYDYTYRVAVTNGGPNAAQVSASIISNSPHTTIIDGSLNFGNVPGGQTVTSQDTFTLRHDRTQPFDPGALVFTFHIGNSPPVARAGFNPPVVVGQTVQLDGSASSDADGDPLTFNWSFVSQPPGSTAVLSNPAAVRPTFVAGVPGTYIVQLIVNDGKVNSAPDTVTIATENTAPVANAGPDQTVRVGQTVQLDGSGSSDPDGDQLTFHWSFVSCAPEVQLPPLSNPAAVRPTFVMDRSGTCVVQLVVNDGKVNSAPDTVTITTENSAPVANAGPDQRALVGQTVQLDGSASSDPDGDPLTFSWSFVSRPTGSTALLNDPAAVRPTFIADRLGTYVVQLIVNDGKVNSVPDTVTITTDNTPPVANAGPNQTVMVGQMVQLDGNASSDVDGDPLTFVWSFVSRPTGSNAVISNPTAVRPTFVADQAGTYVVQLIVNDGKENSTPATVTITAEAGNLPPVANAGPNQTVAVGQTVQLDGSASSDPNGDPLTFNWSFGLRPAGSTAVLNNPAAVMPTFVADRAGTYVVQLIVNDGKVNSAPDTVTITTVNSPPVANAGPDRIVGVGTTVQLDGRGSSDPDNDPLTFRWSLSSRPQGSNAVLSDPTAVRPTFVADVAGNYVVQLIVNDGKSDSPPDSVVITASDTMLGCGSLLQGSIDASAEVDQISFSGQANQRITLTLTAGGFPFTVTASAIVFFADLGRGD